MKRKKPLGKVQQAVAISSGQQRLQEIVSNWIFSFPMYEGISLMAIKDIHLDLERFQNRLEEYSEESVKKIIAHYDPNRFDPVMLWHDLKTRKTYLLSGHSRLEAMKRRKETNIPCRFFQGNESEAILYAKSFSNRAGTAEGLLSDIKAFQLERDGTDKVQKLTQVRLKENWGARYNKLSAFTFLNPKGKFLEYLSTEGKNSFPYIENRAYNVGLWRKNFPQLANPQENEIFDFWYGKGANLTLDEMTNKVSRAVMRLDFDPEKPLHLEKGATGLEARADTAEAQKRLFEIEDELKAIKSKVREAFTQAEKDALRKEVESLLAEKERIERNVKIVTKSQQALFGIRNLTFSNGTVVVLLGETPSQGGTISIHFHKVVLQEVQHSLKELGFNRSLAGNKWSQWTVVVDYVLEKLETILGSFVGVEKTIEVVAKKPKGVKFSRKSPQHLKKEIGVVFKKISYQTAYEAFRGISMSPEKRANYTIKEELEYLRAIYFKFADFARKTDRITEYNQDFNHFQNHYISKVTAWLNALSRVLSVMITGASNFPVHRNNKRLSTEHKRLVEVLEFAQKSETYLDAKYNPHSRQNTVIKTGSSDALQRLEQKLADAQKSQMLAKIINKTIKVGLKKSLTPKEMAEIVTTESGINVTEKLMQEFLSPDSWGRTGVPAYKLTNNNAEIKRLELRIRTEKHYQQKAQEGGNEYTFEGGKVVENYDDNRIEIYFTSIPLQEVRNELKKKAFKWTPTKGAWQKQLISTGNAAKYAVAEVEAIVGKLELIPKDTQTTEVAPAELELTPSNLENLMKGIEKDLETTLTKKRVNKFSRKTPLNRKKGKGLGQIVSLWKTAFRITVEIKVPVDMHIITSYYNGNSSIDAKTSSHSEKAFMYVWTYAQVAKYMYENSLLKYKDKSNATQQMMIKQIATDDKYMKKMDEEFLKRGLNYKFDLFFDTTEDTRIPD